MSEKDINSSSKSRDEATAFLEAFQENLAEPKSNLGSSRIAMGVLGGGGTVVGALLMLILNTFSGNNLKDHETLDKKIEIAYDKDKEQDNKIQDLQIRISNLNISRENTAILLEKLDKKIDLCFEKLERKIDILSERK